ncbi:serine hydrolase [Methyloglobulus sp.]|uniref:serine hydrolase n=1 Tax=Methyloglobulus sp. TaxID=2518622 RepID=UPI0032B72005
MNKNILFRNYASVFCTLVFSLVLAFSTWTAHADLNATTDDRSTAVPTGWWVYTGVTAASVSTFLTQNGARLTDVEIHSIVSGAPRFTVRMVKNSGTYAVPGWWWYYGLTFTQVGTQLTANNARLIDLEPYDAGGGVIRYAAVMVSNTGVAARAWSYLSGVSSSQISTHITNSGHRLIDLDTYFIGASKFYSAVFVANTGTDAKSWQWWINQTVAGATAKINAFGGRLVDLERQPDGTYNIVMVKNSGTDAFGWWWVPDFASITDFMNYASQLAARPVDIETYVNALGQRRYLGIFIDNGNAATKRIRGVFAERFLDANGNPTRGIFEAYLKRVSSSVAVDLNSARSAETASSFKVVHLLHALRRVQAGADNLISPFIYYDYLSGTFNDRKNACPDPAKEIIANQRTDYNLEKGLDEMMSISDNRTTRGMVLRYGSTAINATADLAGMVGTQLRHNIGCAYRNPATNKYSTSLRNDTTAADLAKVYEDVWTSSLLTGTPRSEFLESANPGAGAGTALQSIINAEAALQGKQAFAASFGSLIRTWGKGGSYGTCLPNSLGDCGQKVIIRSGAGLIRIPAKTTGGVVAYRDYTFGRFISDVPVPCFGDDPNIAGDQCPTVTNYEATYSKAANELYREAIRSALLTW